MGPVRVDLVGDDQLRPGRFAVVATLRQAPAVSGPDRSCCRRGSASRSATGR